MPHAILRSDHLNHERCLVDCPVTPFVLNSETEFFESEVRILAWGALATLAHFNGALMGALPLCTQNRDGLLDRMKMMGITHLQLQIVHWITRLMFIIVQNGFMLGCTMLWLQVKFQAGNFFISWFVIVLQSLCGFSFGIFLYGIIRKQVPVIMCVITLEMLASAMSGNTNQYQRYFKMS